MLKIRISGSERELRQIAHKAGNARIQRFKRDKGKVSYAIDVQISVDDFLENLDLGASSIDDSENDTQSGKCNPKEIQVELENLLDEMSDK